MEDNIDKRPAYFHCKLCIVVSRNKTDLYLEAYIEKVSPGARQI
jgi:hypothetical protein